MSAGLIALCVLWFIERPSKGAPTNSAKFERDGYVPLRGAPGDFRNGHYNRMEMGGGYDFQRETGVSIDRGSDLDPTILPGELGQDLKAFLIRLEDLNLEKLGQDLNLEKKPFAAGGGGQVNGKYTHHNLTHFKSALMIFLSFACH